MKNIILAAVLAALPIGAAFAQAPKKPAPTVSLEDRIKACAACHGDKGQGVDAFKDYPKLAGQHADYLAKALRDYKSGLRKNAIMGAQAQDLSAPEIRSLAAHFAKQAGPLAVVR